MKRKPRRARRRSWPKPSLCSWWPPAQVWSAPPCVDGTGELFDGGEILREQLGGIRCRDAGALLEGEHLADHVVGNAGDTRALARGGEAAGIGTAVQPGHVTQQRRERRRRRRHELGDGRRPPAGGDEALAQVDEVTLDLRFRRAPDIFARDRQAVE